jgi:hypothetical protein
VYNRAIAAGHTAGGARTKVAAALSPEKYAARMKRYAEKHRQYKKEYRRIVKEPYVKKERTQKQISDYISYLINKKEGKDNQLQFKNLEKEKQEYIDYLVRKKEGDIEIKNYDEL